MIKKSIKLCTHFLSARADALKNVHFIIYNSSSFLMHVFLYDDCSCLAKYLLSIIIG